MRTTIFVAATAVLLAGCDDLLSSEERVAGTYVLESIDDEPLPYEILGVRIDSGSLTLYSQGTYTAITTSTYEDWETGEPTTENSVETGTFVIVGERVHFVSRDDEETEATLSGRTLRFDLGIISMVYRRD